MSENDSQMNFLPDRRPDRRVVSAAVFVDLRSTGNYLPFSGFSYAFSYTGGLFTHGRSFRS